MGMISEALSGNETGAAHVSNQGAINAIQGIKTPSIGKMKVKLAQLVQQGVISPEMAQTFLQEASSYENLDPRVREAEMGALSQMQGIVDDRGMDPQARAALHELQGETAASERGAREAILQNAAERGISGSGIELASQMGNQQGSATRLANQGFQAAADANARKLAAIQGVSGIAGQVSEQDMQKAAAQDAINQFNAQNRQNIENLNVGARNAAQAQNLSEKQRIADTNVSTANEQELYNKGLYQQDFQNQLQRGQALANAHTGAAQNYLGIAEHKTKPSDKWSDENFKTDVREIDPQSFLDELTGYKYKYKKSDMGEGEHVGPMAQDIEKVAPHAVNDTPEGKTVSYDKLGGEMIAALAAINDRLHELEED